ncbi:hypothetical protein ACLMJK_002008 [Lecanora helva]
MADRYTDPIGWRRRNDIRNARDRRALAAVNGVIIPAKVQTPLHRPSSYKPGVERKLPCPNCGQMFRIRYHIQSHFPACVKQNGNPFGLKFTDAYIPWSERSRRNDEERVTNSDIAEAMGDEDMSLTPSNSGSSDSEDSDSEEISWDGDDIQMSMDPNNASSSEQYPIDPVDLERPHRTLTYVYYSTAGYSIPFKTDYNHLYLKIPWEQIVEDPSTNDGRFGDTPLPLLSDKDLLIRRAFWETIVWREKHDYPWTRDLLEDAEKELQERDLIDARFNETRKALSIINRAREG